MKTPLNYYGYAFEEDGKHNKKLRKQLRKEGFDNSEVWNLDVSICKYTLPRLKRLKETVHGYPSNLTEKKWDKILSKIIWSLETHIDDTILEDESLTPKERLKLYKKKQKGFKLFGKYLEHLWD